MKLVGVLIGLLWVALIAKVVGIGILRHRASVQSGKSTQAWMRTCLLYTSRCV